MLGNYGLTLFVATPFVMGYVSMWVHGHRFKRGVKDLLAVALAFVGIVAIAAEGIICLMMAAPFAWLLALMGGSLALVIHNHSALPNPEPSTFGALVLALPL